MNEPMYEYTKGKGWDVSRAEFISDVRIHNGVSYRVTVLKRPPVPGERATRDYNLNVKWYDDWDVNGTLCQAGFGHASESPNSTCYTVITDKL